MISDFASMRSKLFDSVVRLVRAERWHEQVDGGGSTLAGLLVHIARHQDLAVNVVIRNHEPIFLEHREALGLQNQGLGVGLADRTDGGQGAVVTSVDEGTPAADAGVEIDDLVVAVDGATIDGSTGLIAAIRDLEPGTAIELTIVRDGEEQTYDITLTARPTDIPD